MTVDFDDLIRQMPLEERLYRFRCVERGRWRYLGRFPDEGFGRLRQTAIRCKMRCPEDGGAKDTMLGLKRFWYPWPTSKG